MIFQKKPYTRPFCFIFFIATIVLCAYTFHKHSLAIIHWIDKLGWFAPVLFLLVYSLATILFLPTMVLTLAGGALFGPFFGTTLNLFGATIGAALSFLITRHLVYDWFSKKRGPKMNRLITGVEEQGWFFIALLRLFPIVPFNIVNYGLGITHIQFRLYLLTTFIFLIPAEILYTYLGYAGMGALLGQEHLSGGFSLLWK